MHYLLYVQLSGLYCKALEEADSDLALRPLVVHKDKIVLDSNQEAKAQNVWRGMSVAEAKAILQGAQFKAWEAEPYRAIQEQWLEISCNYSDVVEPDDQHSAWVDLTGQPDAEALAYKLTGNIKEQLGLSSRVGLAGTKWLAKLACDCSPGQEEGLIQQLALREPCSNPELFLSSLKTRQLSPVPKLHLDRLEFLGYRTIGEVAHVPLEVLRGQFGDEATHILNCARGSYFQPVIPSYPANSLCERVSFEGVIDDLQTLDHALQKLAMNFARRLKSEDLQSKELLMHLDQENGCLVKRRKFTKPISNYPSALASLRLLFKSFEMAEKGLTGVRARLENVERILRIQQELTGRVGAPDRLNGISSACEQIKTVFGDGAILTGNEVKMPRRKLVLKAWRDATGWA